MHLASFSQSTDLAVQTSNDINVDSSKGNIVYNISQTKEAFLQLQSYAAKNIEYPSHLLNYGLEGTVVVAITIDSEMKIEQMKIVKSFSSDFNSSVLKQLKALKVLDIAGEVYKGQPTVYVPVKFSLK